MAYLLTEYCSNCTFLNNDFFLSCNSSSRFLSDPSVVEPRNVLLLS